MLPTLALGATMLLSALPTQAWSAVEPILTSVSWEVYLRVHLPFRIDSSPDGHYASLRVVDDHDLEVPYALDPSGAREIVFRAEPGRHYRLLWGNPHVQPPLYDLPAILAHERWTAIPATLGRTFRVAGTP
jgi:hypothetical protein